MVFLVRGRGAENIKKIGKKTEEKHWKMRRKKNEEYRESQVTTINIFDFTFYILYFAWKQSLKKVVYTVAFYLQFLYVAGYLKSSNGFALVFRPQDFRPEIHINRLGITT